MYRLDGYRVKYATIKAAKNWNSVAQQTQNTGIYVCISYACGSSIFIRNMFIFGHLNVVCLFCLHFRFFRYLCMWFDFPFFFFSFCLFLSFQIFNVRCFVFDVVAMATTDFLGRNARCSKHFQFWYKHISHAIYLFVNEMQFNLNDMTETKMVYTRLHLSSKRTTMVMTDQHRLDAHKNVKFIKRYLSMHVYL